VEYAPAALSARTHKHSLDLPEPPSCGRCSPDMQPAHWSSNGHIRFRRDTVDDPAFRRESFPAAKLSPQRPHAPWGVPEEALIQQKVGGWTVRRGYLTSVILGVAPESPCAFPPGRRRSTGLRVTGAARDPVDDTAVRLAAKGYPLRWCGATGAWQYAFVHPPSPRATPAASVPRPNKYVSIRSLDLITTRDVLCPSS
jgi:hypothetical protein